MANENTHPHFKGLLNSIYNPSMVEQSNDKTTCEWCEDISDTTKVDGYSLCADCKKTYDKAENKTGSCSLSCIMSGCCDESC